MKHEYVQRRTMIAQSVETIWQVERCVMTVPLLKTEFIFLRMYVEILRAGAGCPSRNALVHYPLYRPSLSNENFTAHSTVSSNSPSPSPRPRPTLPRRLPLVLRLHPPLHLARSHLCAQRVSSRFSGCRILRRPFVHLQQCISPVSLDRFLT